MIIRSWPLVAILVLLTACGTASPGASTTSAGSGGTTTSASPAPTRLRTLVSIPVDGRPANLHLPKTYSTQTPAPLVIGLHGYQNTGAELEAYLKLMPESDRRGFLYAMPDGTQDSNGDRFWNATDACCDLFHSTVDDSRYLSDLIRTIERQYTVDTHRVYLVGHSNGAFMAYRMACDHADQITAIVALNGAMWNDVSRCAPSRPVSVLDIRGTADDTIHFAGGTSNATYPSAATTEADWVHFDQCPAVPARTAAALDLTPDVPGAETSVTTYGGCANGSVVVSWVIDRGSHVPTLGPAFAPGVVDFLYARTTG